MRKGRFRNWKTLRTWRAATKSKGSLWRGGERSSYRAIFAGKGGLTTLPAIVTMNNGLPQFANVGNINREGKHENVMKRIVASLMVCALLLCTAPAGMAQGDTVIGSCQARVQFNLRAQPDEDAEMVCNLVQGADLTILESGDEWCKVRTTNGAYTGYAKTSWLKYIQLNATAAPQLEQETEQAALATVTDLREGTDLLTYPAIGESDTDEVRYICMTRVQFNIREEPSDDGRRIKQIDKGDELRVLAWGSEWCKVQSMDGKYTGYAKNKWLFHYHSLNRFLWDVPGYETYRLNGYVVMTGEQHITDSGDYYGGNTLHAGDIIFVKDEPSDTVETLLRREFVAIDADKVEYHALTPWREAKAGDVIGGYTQFYGEKQGGAYYVYRKRNIKLAMSLMDQTVIPSGSEYSFLENVGPVTKGNGYYVAGITGGEGSGVGGGICHTSTLMYQAALSLPFQITEREPHTDNGTTYAPLEFDATVGVYSDLRFINTLPYDVKMEAKLYPETGAITVMFVCMETVDPEILASWDGSELDIVWE